MHRNAEYRRGYKAQQPRDSSSVVLNVNIQAGLADKKVSPIEITSSTDEMKTIYQSGNIKEKLESLLDDTRTTTTAEPAADAESRGTDKSRLDVTDGELGADAEHISNNRLLAFETRLSDTTKPFQSRVIPVPRVGARGEISSGASVKRFSPSTAKLRRWFIKETIQKITHPFHSIRQCVFFFVGRDRPKMYRVGDVSSVAIYLRRSFTPFVCNKTSFSISRFCCIPYNFEIHIH